MEVICPRCKLEFSEDEAFVCACSLVWCCPWCWENDTPPYHSENNCEERHHD
jgi:hypothetical protein